MSDRPTHKTVSCPECAAPFDRAIVWFGDREFMADRGCLCDRCESSRQQAVAAADAESRHLALWARRVPEDYHRASVAEVASWAIPALNWAPSEGRRRLGLHGTPGSGKSMAVALVVKTLRIPFRWTNGFAARSIYNLAVSGEDPEKRRTAAMKWERLTNCDLLVLDDVDKGNFTEAWAGALFDLLEFRNGARLPTIWTANLGPGPLARKIGDKCKDQEQADAIERRLCGGALLISTK